MRAINGGKVEDDRVDARKIADLLRGNLFALAYDYAREMRPTRDLLSRRRFFMWRRARTDSHLQVICTQHGVIDLEPKIVKDKQRRTPLNSIKLQTRVGCQTSELATGRGRPVKTIRPISRGLVAAKDGQGTADKCRSGAPSTYTNVSCYFHRTAPAVSLALTGVRPLPDRPTAT